MRTHLKTLVVAAVTLALLGWFFRQADLSQVWREIRSADAWALILMVGVTGLTYLLRALRWQVLLEPLGPTRLREAFRTTVIGFAANTVLPARIGVQWAQRRILFQESTRSSLKVAVTLAPTFIFTLVLAGILREQYGLPETWYGALLVYAFVSTALPSVLRGREAAFDPARVA